MRRIGKFYITIEAVDSGSIAEILGDLGFVPHRVECLFHKDKFEYIGTSHKFKAVVEGHEIPEYLIDVSHNEKEDALIATPIAI